MQMLQPGDLLSLRQAAEILGLTTKSTQRLIARDELVAVKIGGVWRINRHDLEAFARVGTDR